MKKHTSVKEILADTTVPVVAIDRNAMITMVNDAFQSEYGWPGEELVGQPVTAIMPPYLRDAHQIGFSRFVTTEKPRVQGKALQVEVFHKDEHISNVELFILSEKINNEWRFAATIVPVS